MAFNGRYIGVDAVIEKVRREFMFEEVHKEAVLEWVYETMSNIGVLDVFQDRITTISIEDYRGSLPPDLYEIKPAGIRDHFSKISMRQSTDSSYMLNSTSTESPFLTRVIQYSGEHNLYNSTIFEDNGTTAQYTSSTTLDDTASFYYTANRMGTEEEMYTYKINGSFIFTGFMSGVIDMSYVAFPLDDNQMPMIPDDEKYIRMLIYYIGMKIANVRWYAHPENRGYSAVKQDIERKYYAFAGAARNKILLPNVDQMESIKNWSLRMITKTNEFDRGFRYQGDVQKIKHM